MQFFFGDLILIMKTWFGNRDQIWIWFWIGIWIRIQIWIWIWKEIWILVWIWKEILIWLWISVLVWIWIKSIFGFPKSSYAGSNVASFIEEEKKLKEQINSNHIDWTKVFNSTKASKNRQRFLFIQFCLKLWFRFKLIDNNKFSFTILYRLTCMRLTFPYRRPLSQT